LLQQIQRWILQRLLPLLSSKHKRPPRNSVLHRRAAALWVKSETGTASRHNPKLRAWLQRKDPLSGSVFVRTHYRENAHRSALTMAGLWDEWRDIETKEPSKSCTMIITEANDFVREVHDRMPVILEGTNWEAWLSGEAGKELLAPAGDYVLQRWPVSRRVNSSRADDSDATLIERIELPAAGVS
jgi:hypothetical protein